MAKKINKTPAQTRRNALAEAIKARGHSPYNIWVVRPPFADEDLLLTSDIAFELFYYLEGDPRYVEIEYPGLKATYSEGPVSISDFMFAYAADSCGQIAQIKFSHTPASISESNEMYEGEESPTRIVTLDELNSNVQRVENWRRIIPCIRRVKLLPMATLERVIVQSLRDGKHQTIRQILKAHSNESTAKLLGGIALALRHRYIEADLDTKPWSLNTWLWVETE
jgi:hypothetical protein